jgi:hypothetical protein
LEAHGCSLSGRVVLRCNADKPGKRLHNTPVMAVFKR